MNTVEAVTRNPVPTDLRAALNPGKSTSVLAARDPGESARMLPPLYIVNDSEQSVQAVLRRWSRAAKVNFTWNANFDYAVSSGMRSIQAGSYADAVARMRAELMGVEIPVKVDLGSDGLYVSLAISSTTTAYDAPRRTDLQGVPPVFVVEPQATSEQTGVAARNPTRCATHRTDSVARCRMDVARSTRGSESLARWRKAHPAIDHTLLDGRADGVTVQ